MVLGDKYRTDKYRIGGIAMFDVGLTAIAAVGVAYMAEKKVTFSGFMIAFVLMIILGIIAHVVVKQPTKLNYYLGLSNERKDNEGPGRFI